MKLTSTFYIAFLLTIIIISCDAPKNNPLESFIVEPDTVIVHRTDTVKTTIIDTTFLPLYVVQGHVTSMHSTPQAVQNVVVTLNGNISVTTNSQGYFKIESVGKQNGSLIFMHPDYIEDSTAVLWGAADTLIELNKQIDKLPTLTGEEFYSSIINDHGDDRYGSLNLSGRILDDDYNSITGVVLRSTQFADYNVAIGDNGQFNLQLYETDINVNNIDNIVGKDLSIIVRYNEREFIAGTINFTRVIRDYVEYISPANGEVLNTRNPYLEWKLKNTGYSFTYTIEVYTDAVNPVLVWSASRITPSAINRRVGTRLANGNYFWVIWIVDEYGNRSRSKPASFIIQSEN